MASNTFSKNPDVLKKATAAAHTPEALKKRSENRAVNRLVKNEIFNNLRESLLKQTGDKTYYSDFINKFLTDAKQHPAGGCGKLLASAIFSPELLNNLDEASEKEMAKNLDFLRYRIIKECFRQQRDVIIDTERARKITIMCSRRAGKTYTARSLINYVAVNPDSPIFYYNLTFNNAVEQMFDIVVQEAENIGLGIKRKSKIDGIINFVNNSVVNFRGNKDNSEADKSRGFKARCVIIDEAGHQRNMEYLINDVIQPMLADYTDSVLVLQGTPPRAPHTYFERAVKSSEYAHYSWTMMENPNIPNPEELIKSICVSKGLTIDSPLIQREYLGKIAYDTEAQVFRGYKTFTAERTGAFINIPKNFIPDAIYIGNDYGWAAYNGIVGIACNTKLKQAYIYYEHKFNRASVSDVVNSNRVAVDEGRKLIMRSPANDIGNVKIYGDTSDNSTIYEMSQTYGLPAFKAYKYDKATAIEQLAEEMRTGRLLIPAAGACADECDQTLYKRDSEDHIIAEIDDDVFHPDIMMALLYASRAMFVDYGYDTGGTASSL
ncbi:Uncharacterised protein [uncultured archaeon]|nr:Uncharacterised protein [uncultured archaeon]